MWKLLNTLLENADLIEEIVSALAGGATKDAIRLAIRKVKIEASDAAMRDEFDIPG